MSGICLQLNGRWRTETGVAPTTTLLDYLRLNARLTGTKEGCAEGDCGACTVVLSRLRDGRLVREPVNSCILPLGHVDGAEVIAIEDIAEGETPHPVQAEMVARHGSQCGFCTPGIVMSLFALHEEAPRPIRREDVLDALAGNLCRCTGYRPIVEAALAACATPSSTRFAFGRAGTASALSALDDRAEVFVGDAERFFAAPATEDELARLCLAHPDATLVAGATDVGLWITKALLDIRKAIWLGRVSDLDAIGWTAPGHLRLGATASLSRAREALSGIDPDLGELMRRFGSAQVRASGTVGGNIANGSPIGDLAPALIALGASLELRRGDAIRTMPLEAFFLAYRKQDRAPGEFVRAVAVEALEPSDRFRCLKLSKRPDEDISCVMGAFRLRLDGTRVAAARLAYGGMAGTPKRAAQAEAALIGADLAERSSWDPALAAIERDFQPLDDHRASAAYRRAGARNLLLKALLEIAGRELAGAAPETRLFGARPALEAAQ